MNRKEQGPQWFGALAKTWDRLESTREGRREFGACLAKLGFMRAPAGCFKNAYTSFDGKLVMKWDIDPEADKTKEHVWTEFVTWRNSTKRKKRYLAPIIRYRNGLVLQATVKECNERCWEKLRVMSLASALKISHWYHHGHAGRSVRFFDYDTFGLIDDDVEELVALARNQGRRIPVRRRY